jgi:hypothetical protein
VRPTVCTRCARSSESWTFERDQGVAGCPCGEVIPYAFDDAPLQVLSKTPKKPGRWSEDARSDGFTGTLLPSTRWLWSLPLLLLVLNGARVALTGAATRDVPSLLLLVAAMVAVPALAISRGARRWTFSIQGGRFRAEARGHVTDIPLEEIQRFDATPISAKRKPNMTDAGTRFQLVVSRTNGERTRVPLFVDSADEAEFIVERANAMLATDGRTIGGDYRGRHVRVGDVAATPTRIETGAGNELDEPDDDAETGEAAGLRRHLGD